jgi:magnesium chelatase family protein
MAHGVETVEGSREIAERVARARATARERLAGTGWTTNSQATGPWLRAHTPAEAMRDATRAVDRGMLTMRGFSRVLRVAWSIADLAGRDAPEREDVGRALTLRRASDG